MTLVFTATELQLLTALARNGTADLRSVVSRAQAGPPGAPIAATAAEASAAEAACIAFAQSAPGQPDVWRDFAYRTACWLQALRAAEESMLAARHAQSAAAQAQGGIDPMRRVILMSLASGAYPQLRPLVARVQDGAPFNPSVEEFDVLEGALGAFTRQEGAASVEYVRSAAAWLEQIQTARWGESEE